MRNESENLRFSPGTMRTFVPELRTTKSRFVDAGNTNLPSTRFTGRVPCTDSDDPYSSAFLSGATGCSAEDAFNLQPSNRFRRYTDAAGRASSNSETGLIDAIIYARVSTNEQKLGYSLDAQLETTQSYAAAHGLRVIKVFRIAESAKKQGRKVFNAMIDYALTHPNVRVIIVEKPDRLLRNLDDFNLVEQLASERGLEFHLAKDREVIRRDSNSRERLVQGFHALLSKYYSDNLREEAMKGQRVKSRRGEYPGRAPYGYVNDKVSGAIMAHPARARVVEQIFELYATGRYSVKTLRKAILRETGEKISKSRLDQLLKSRFYIGFFTWGQEEYEGIHPKLVDENTFSCVQRVLAGKSKSKPHNHDFAYGDLMYCAEDGCKVTAEMHKGIYVYYHCTFGKGKHAFPYLRESKVGELLGTVLKQITIPADVAHRIANFDQNTEANEEARRQETVIRLQQRLSTINTRIDKAYDDRYDGLIPEDTWARKMKEWEAQKAGLVADLEHAQNIIPQHHGLTAEKIHDLAARAHEIYGSLTDAERANLLRMMTAGIATDGVTVHPEFRQPFNLIVRGIETPRISNVSSIA